MTSKCHSFTFTSFCSQLYLQISEISIKFLILPLPLPSGYLISGHIAVADPDLELRDGVGGGLDLLALLAFIPSVISSFFTQNKGGPGPSPRSTTALG